MCGLKPENGLIIKYDFLWKDEASKGQVDGSKEHPCAVVLTRNEQPDGGLEVVVCAISHSPPIAGENAVEIPDKVAKYLNLDDRRSWIKTQEVNIFTWEKDRIPVGLVRTPAGGWSYGVMPPRLYRAMRDSIIKNSRDKSLRQVRRD